MYIHHHIVDLQSRHDGVYETGFQTEWLEGYVQTYLERDLRQLSAVDNLVDFRRLMQMAAAKTGSILNISSVANDAAIATATAGRYLNLLETSFQTQRIPAYAVNRGKRLIKSPKLLWSDTGLAAHLAGILSAGELRNAREWGAFLETWFGNHLLVFASLMAPRATMYHWRTSNGQEVDFALERGRRLLPIEVKSTTRPGSDDAKGLSLFLETYPEAPFGLIACNCEVPKVISRNVVALPITRLLLT